MRSPILSKIHKEIPWIKVKNAVAACLVVLSFALTILAVVPDQPFMQNVRADLQKARTSGERHFLNQFGSSRG